MPTKQEIVVRFDLVNNDLKPRAIDGKELPNWQEGPQMAEYILQLEKEGWRITEQVGAGTYHFEREVP